jgi:hypothetical protein
MESSKTKQVEQNANEPEWTGEEQPHFEDPSGVLWSAIDLLGVAVHAKQGLRSHRQVRAGSLSPWLSLQERGNKGKVKPTTINFGMDRD